jgi:hypothetical protein
MRGRTRSDARPRGRPPRADAEPRANALPSSSPAPYRFALAGGIRVPARLGELPALRVRHVAAPHLRSRGVADAPRAADADLDLARSRRAGREPVLGIQRPGVAVLGRGRRARARGVALAHDLGRVRAAVGGGARDGRARAAGARGPRDLRPRLPAALAGAPGDARGGAAGPDAVAARDETRSGTTGRLARGVDLGVGERAHLVAARRGADRPARSRGPRAAGARRAAWPRAHRAARGRGGVPEPVRLAVGVAAVRVPVRVAERPAALGHLRAPAARLGPEPLERPAAAARGLAAARPVAHAAARSRRAGVGSVCVRHRTRAQRQSLRRHLRAARGAVVRARSRRVVAEPPLDAGRRQLLARGAGYERALRRTAALRVDALREPLRHPSGRPPRAGRGVRLHAGARHPRARVQRLLPRRLHAVALLARPGTAPVLRHPSGGQVRGRASRLPARVHEHVGLDRALEAPRVRLRAAVPAPHARPRAPGRARCGPRLVARVRRRRGGDLRPP